MTPVESVILIEPPLRTPHQQAKAVACCREQGHVIHREICCLVCYANAAEINATMLALS